MRDEIIPVHQPKQQNDLPLIHLLKISSSSIVNFLNGMFAFQNTYN